MIGWSTARAKVKRSLFFRCINNDQLCYWLPQFILEARNKKGDEYIGCTIYASCTAIQHVFQENVVGSNGPSDYVFKDSYLCTLSVLDSKLKNLHSGST